MLATARRVLQVITRRRRAPALDASLGKLPSMRRRAWAQSVQRLLDDASRSSSGVQFPHPDWEAPLLLRTKVVLACRPELLAIKDALHDARQPISAAAVQQLKAFLTDPSVSPLFGGDPLAARRAVEQLQYSFTGHPEP
jgi:hypothetical protein